MLFYMMFFLYGIWIFEALRRNGLNPGKLVSALNPFAAIHRAHWRSKMNTNPLYALSDATEAMSVLLVSLIKSTGEITTQQKELVLHTLRVQCKLSEEEASHSFVQASFLLRDTMDILGGVPRILAPLIGSFTPEEATELQQALMVVSTENGRVKANAYQLALIARVLKLLAESPKQGI